MSICPLFSKKKAFFHVLSPDELMAVVGMSSHDLVRAVGVEGDYAQMLRDLCKTFNDPLDTRGDIYRVDGGNMNWFGAIFREGYTAVFKPLMNNGKDHLFYTWNTPSRLCIGVSSKKPFDSTNESLVHKRYMASPERDLRDVDDAMSRVFGEEYPFIHYFGSRLSAHS